MSVSSSKNFGFPSFIWRYMPSIMPFRGGLQISSPTPPNPGPVQWPASQAMSAMVAAGGRLPGAGMIVCSVTLSCAMAVVPNVTVITRVIITPRGSVRGPIGVVIPGG